MRLQHLPLRVHGATIFPKRHAAISLQDLIVSLRKIGALRALRVNAKLLQVRLKHLYRKRLRKNFRDAVERMLRG